MKIFILLFLIIGTTATSQAALSYSLYCSGNRGRVAVAAYTRENRLYVQYSNALGAADFPLYEGIVTRTTIPYVNIAEKELASLDYEVLVSWPMEKCEFNGHDSDLMRCGGEAQFHHPQNSPVQSISFSTAKVTEEGLSGTFRIFKIRWGLVGENFHHFLALPFDPTKCQTSLKE